MPVTAETQLRLSSNEKTQPTDIVNFYAKTEQKRILYHKKILSTSICKKYCTMLAEKYQSRLYNGRCRLLYFLLNPWKIFGWCLLGNVQSTSYGDASFLNHRSVIFPCRHRLEFFLSVSGNHVFLPRSANVFPAKQMKTSRCQPKQKFSRARTKKTSRRHCKFLRQHWTKNNPLP